MTSLLISIAAFGCVFTGALLGFWLRRRLPQEHLSDESKLVLQLGTGLIATMAALVLGMLTAGAKAKFDTQSDEVMQTAANVVLLDRALAHYGSETAALRSAFRTAVQHRVEQWDRNAPVQGGAPPAIEAVQDAIRALAPANDAQKALQDRAEELAREIARIRWLALEQSGSSVSWPFLTVMIFWLFAIFVSFGLLAPPNATVVVVLLVSAVSVSTAIFLTLELDQPFHGLIHISSEPMKIALQNLGI